MDRTEAIAWVLSLAIGVLRKSQAKTLSDLVGGALGAARLSLAAVGRQLAEIKDQSAKAAIKRVWRFVSNRRIEPLVVMPALMNRFWRRKLKWHAQYPQRRPLLVSLDWTKVRSFHTLLAAVIVEGRALPWCWESYRDQVQGKSQNALEEGMLARLRAALPAEVKLVILADRGFGRAALALTCQQKQIDYLIRIHPDVIVRTARWQGNLKHYPLKRGACQGWRDVEYRADGLVTTHLILRWKENLDAAQEEPWYLITSLRPGPRGTRRFARQLSDLYALRFDIEEFFRDAKNEHLGWSLAQTRMTRPQRLDRLILILALAYVLLVALGLWCRRNRPAQLWASNNRPHDLSAFAIGRVMRTRLHVAVVALLAVLLEALNTLSQKWG